MENINNHVPNLKDRVQKNRGSCTKKSLRFGYPNLNDRVLIINDHVPNPNGRVPKNLEKNHTNLTPNLNDQIQTIKSKRSCTKNTKKNYLDLATQI